MTGTEIVVFRFYDIPIICRGARFAKIFTVLRSKRFFIVFEPFTGTVIDFNLSFHNKQVAYNQSFRFLLPSCLLNKRLRSKNEHEGKKTQKLK